MLCPLALPGLWIILLPRKARPLPVLIYVRHEIDPQVCVDLPRLLLTFTLCLRDRQDVLEDQVVHIHPDWAAPVVLICAVQRVLETETADAVLTPKFFGVGDEVEDGFEMF